MKYFRDSTPFAFVRLKLIWSAVITENTTISHRARDTATFRRFHPPSRFSGPKFMDSFPSASGPNATENRITSRSSPWTFSKFLTNSGSSPIFAHLSKFKSFWYSSWSRSSIRVCWLTLKVTTPIVCFFCSGSAYLFLISATIACASPSFTRLLPRSKKPSTFTMLTRLCRSFTDGNVSIEFS